MPLVTVTTLTTAESEPAAPDSAWALSRMLVADISRGGWELTSTWTGGVGLGRTSAEKRVSTSNRPLRHLRYTLSPDSAATSWLIYNGMRRRRLPVVGADVPRRGRRCRPRRRATR